MPGAWVRFCTNPNPATDTSQGAEDRQWAALHSSGIIMVSHGLKVPTDTPGQPDRGSTLANVAWTMPRWGWQGASMPTYQPEAGRDLRICEWTPDDISGYAMDTYGGIWPIGSTTPFAATGYGGAPFGPISPSGAPIYKHFDMHSANGLSFGLGGFPSGYGWILSYDGVFYNNVLDPAGQPYWPVGPAPALQDPYLDILGTPGMTPLNNNGIPGSNPTVNSSVIADFQVNPNNSGEFYVLFWSGRIYTGHAVGVAATHSVTNAQPVGTSGNAYLLPHVDAITGNPDPFVGMAVNWGDSIVAMTARGALWGYNLNPGADTFPAFPGPPPWQDGAAGGWIDMDVAPYKAPSHIYAMGATGTILSTVIAGTVTISGLSTGGSHTTTTTPTLTWTYSAQYGVPQKAIQVRVYRQSYIDAQGGFVTGQLAGTDDGWLDDRDTAVASDKINRNLVNGAAYRAYVRVQSAANTWSAWVNLAFTMAIPVPAQPSSCVATPVPNTYPSLGTVNITAGGGIGGGEARQFQVSVGGNAFVDVWDAEATTSATVTDPWPATSVPLTYRVRAFKRVPGVVASAWRTASPVTLNQATGTPTGYRFIDVGPGGAGPVVILPLEVPDVGTIAAASFDRVEERGEFQTFGQAAKTVTSAGVKGDDHAVTLKSLSGTQYAAIYKMLSLTRPILYQNGFHRQWWVRPTPGTWKTLQMGAMAGETSGIRDAYDITLRLVEVNPPR